MVPRRYSPPFLSLFLERVTLVEQPFAVEEILAAAAV
jgi:hypothetical protein